MESKTFSNACAREGPSVTARRDDAGAQIIIAVDVTAHPGSAPAGASAKMLLRDAKRRARIDPEVAQADFLIHPNLDYATGPSRRYFVKAQKTGEETARKRLPELKHALAAKFEQ